MLTVLKLKSDKTFTIPFTGITLKSGQPIESPAEPILVITSFTSALNRSTFGLSFDIYFEIYGSPSNFAQAYTRVYSSFISIPEQNAYLMAEITVEAGTINLIDKVRQLLVQILLSQPEFADWELTQIELPA